MKLTRRDFLKASAGAAFLPLLQPSAVAKAAESTPEDGGLAMLVDVTKCVNCWWCYAACKNYNRLTETISPNIEEPPVLSTQCWTTLSPVKRGDRWISRKNACNHCTEAACVDVCPTGALSHHELGFVQYDKDKCSGCGYCVEFCPFGIPRIDDEGASGMAFMDKCTFCRERVVNGLPTACADACPTGAISFGRRNELLDEGKARVKDLCDASIDARFYGEKEVGGTHVMYVLDDKPEAYGLPPDPEVPTPIALREVLKWLGAGVAALAAVSLGINYLIAKARIARGGK